MCLDALWRSAKPWMDTGDRSRLTGACTKELRVLTRHRVGSSGRNGSKPLAWRIVDGRHHNTDSWLTTWMRLEALAGLGWQTLPLHHWWDTWHLAPDAAGVGEGPTVAGGVPVARSFAVDDGTGTGALSQPSRFVGLALTELAVVY